MCLLYLQATKKDSLTTYPGRGALTAPI